MNKLKITLNEDGSVEQFTPDFKIVRGCYGNVLLNIAVPHSLLLEPVSSEESELGNNVRIGAIISTATGENIKTKKYELQRVKDYTINGVGYRLYQRKLPKEFTMWDTVNLQESTMSGKLVMVINVVNWVMNNNQTKIETIVATPKFNIDIYPSDYLGEEDIEEPSDLSILQSQVQEIETSVENVEKDLYGIDDKGLGEYLLKRIFAGNKITIEKDTKNSPNGLKISLIPMEANEVSIKPIDEIKSQDVQGALEELNKRSNSKNIDSVTGIDEGMVDNTDEYNPVILHDPSKTDKSVYLEKIGEIDNSISSLQTSKADKSAFETKTAQQDTEISNLKSNKADLVDGKVPSSQLPSYIDDVLEYPTYSQLPAVGEDGKIYVTLDTNLTYRWGGTEYIEISPSLALGETANTAYRGDRGKIAYDHSQRTGNPHGTKLSEVAEDATHRTVTDAEKQKWNTAEKNVQSNWNETDPTSSAFIQNKPTIPTGLNLYSSTGQKTDGAMTQKAATDELNKKVVRAQGIKNKNKLMGTDSNGNVQSQDYIFIGGDLKLSKETDTTTGEVSLVIEFPEEA